MFDLEELELWNVAPGVVSIAGAQSIFNVVGRLRLPSTVESMSYCLNGSDAKRVVFQAGGSGAKRLVGLGDFNIDTILAEELREENRLTIRVQRHRRPLWETDVEFPVRWFRNDAPLLRLDLENAKEAQEVGQIVDGRWHLTHDESRPFLEIAAGDAGYDRTIIFGDRNWTDGYEVRARLCVVAWAPGISQGAGLAFKWNSHRQGDGRDLPEEWSSGVAWYFSESPGLTIRVGASARKDVSGRWLGESVLAERTLTPWRRGLSRWARRMWPARHLFSQIRAGRTYEFRLQVEPRRYALSMEAIGVAAAPVELEIVDPPQLIAGGSIGVIAHGCALRLYRLEIRPLS